MYTPEQIREVIRSQHDSVHYEVGYLLALLASIFNEFPEVAERHDYLFNQEEK